MKRAEVQNGWRLEPVALVSMKALLEAGVHFGHRTPRWNPKMRGFIFTERKGIHIIDLQQTLTRLEEAYNVARDLASEGKVLLFVGTKKQAADTVREAAERCGMPYVNERWLGGTLTNFRTIRQRIDYLLDLERKQASGELDRLPKKEAQKLAYLIENLNRRLGGLKGLKRLPDALFIVDVSREEIAVKEASRLGIPIIAMVDTNGDPDPIDYVIPSNDDAIRAIRLVTNLIADAVVEGRQIYESREAERIAEEEIVAEEGVPSYEPVELPEEVLLGPSTLEKIRAARQPDRGYEVEEVEVEEAEAMEVEEEPFAEEGLEDLEEVEWEEEADEE